MSYVWNLGSLRYGIYSPIKDKMGEMVDDSWWWDRYFSQLTMSWDRIWECSQKSNSIMGKSEIMRWRDEEIVRLIIDDHDMVDCGWLFEWRNLFYHRWDQIIFSNHLKHLIYHLIISYLTWPSHQPSRFSSHIFFRFLANPTDLIKVIK